MEMVQPIPTRAQSHARGLSMRTHLTAVEPGLRPGWVQHRKSAIHGLLVTVRMLRIKSDISDWIRSHSIVFEKPIRSGISLDLSRGCDSWC